MYNKVSALPATGTGAAVLGGGAYAYGVNGLIWWAIVVVAVFTLIGACAAFARTMPALRFHHNNPKQLAPKDRPELPRQLRYRR